jgi:hypothetical protein
MQKLSNDDRERTLPKSLNRIIVLEILLYSPGISGRVNEPVSGRTRLQKETFLVQEELRKLGVKSLYSFRPYKLGPMSYDLYNDLDWLKFEGILKEEKQTLADGTEYSKFTLTQKGIAEVDHYLTDPVWKTVLERIIEIKKATNSVNLSYLVDTVHRAHPEYVLSVPVVKLLEALANSTGHVPTKTTPDFHPRKHKAKTPVTEEVRILRSNNESS